MELILFKQMDKNNKSFEEIKHIDEILINSTMLVINAYTMVKQLMILQKEKD